MERLSLFLLWFPVLLVAQPDQQVIYKIVEGDTLTLNIYHPPTFNPDSSYPGVVFFFGGGWNGGTPAHFVPQSEHLAQRGMIAICADYRTKKRHGTDPFAAVMDARSAMRYVQGHYQELNLDSNRIGAGGGSAGGHLAATCALISEINDPQDNLSISPKPDALLLFNPVIDNGPGGYGFERIGEAYPTFSPLHNIRTGAPPTLFLLGTEDALIPVATAQYYQTVMERVGSRCDLHLYEGGEHGFFNPGRSEHADDTIEKMDAFLVSLGWLKEKVESDK